MFRLLVKLTGFCLAISFIFTGETLAEFNLSNYWPMQLGNHWEYEVTEFKNEEFELWERNFRGYRSGINNPNRNCQDKTYREGVLGSKVALELLPSSGYNRFNTSRYLQFYKEKGAAYHGPKYCNLIPEAPNSWNLQWFMHNVVYKNGIYWLGSEGGVRFFRAELNGSPSSESLEKMAEFSSIGFFPKNQGLHYGGGRIPAVDAEWEGLPGYTYLPLNSLPDKPNTFERVIPDMSYDFGGGILSDKNDFRNGVSTYLNDKRSNKLVWDLEFIPLKAKNVLKKGLLPSETEILSIIFFEPYYRNYNSDPNAELPENEEIACENWYFAKEIGLVKLTHSVVAVLPNDPDLKKTRTLCFFIYKEDFINSTNPNKRISGFKDIEPYLSEINQFYYHFPKNSFEIIGYTIKHNPSEDSLGFHSPEAASLIDIPEPFSLEYFSNGRFWLYKPNGELYLQGNLYQAWKDKGIKPVRINNHEVYPWTDNGPDASENGNDLVFLFKHKGIIVNNGAYWLRDAGTANPFPCKEGEYGLITDLLPGYDRYFGNDTENLGIAGTDFNEIFIQKDGIYLYFGKNSEGKLYITREGRNSDLQKWANAPRIAGYLPLFPDTIMFGPFLNQAYNYIVQSDGSRSEILDNPVPSDKQLIIFQKGAVWVKYGYEGEFETWKNHLKSGFTINFPTPTDMPVDNFLGKGWNKSSKGINPGNWNYSDSCSLFSKYENSRPFWRPFVYNYSIEGGLIDFYYIKCN